MTDRLVDKLVDRCRYLDSVLGPFLTTHGTIGFLEMCAGPFLATSGTAGLSNNTRIVRSSMSDQVSNTILSLCHCNGQYRPSINLFWYESTSIDIDRFFSAVD